jgi:predicted transposase/invertase (TIGR01784 family)
VTPEELHKIVGKDRVIKKAYDELNSFYWTEDELMRYDTVIKREKDYEAVLDQKYEDGLNQGKIEGKAEGKAEGRIEERREMAMKMFTKGMDDALIAEFSGLSHDEIVALKTS